MSLADAYFEFTTMQANEDAASPPRSKVTTPTWHVGIPRTKLERARHYTHPNDVVPKVTLAEFALLKQQHGDAGVIKSLPWNTVFNRDTAQKKCVGGSSGTYLVQPMYIGPLYCSERFPYYPMRADGGCTMVDSNKIFDGQVRTMETSPWNPETNRHAIRHPPFLALGSEFVWRGYSTSFYDGDLYFWPLSRDSYIEGISATGYFCIDCDKLVEGDAPGAIHVYQLSQNK